MLKVTKQQDIQVQLSLHDFLHHIKVLPMTVDDKDPFSLPDDFVIINEGKHDIVCACNMRK